MTDIFPPEKRSEIMRKIKGKDTKPELIFRYALWHNGFRYRKHYKVSGMKIDVAFPGKKLAIFIDGCFWHGCKEHGSIPKSNVEFWNKKIKDNIERDSRNVESLEKRRLGRLPFLAA